MSVIICVNDISSEIFVFFCEFVVYLFATIELRSSFLVRFFVFFISYIKLFVTRNTTKIMKKF